MMLRDQINLSYLRRLNPATEQILFTGKFTSLKEFDQCTQLWHSVGFQGPFFLVKAQEIQFIILNQNSTSDFVRVFRKGLQYEMIKHNSWYYLHFQDDQKKVYNIWFHNEDDYKQFEACLQCLK